jgi:hypothetical protein
MAPNENEPHGSIVYSSAACTDAEGAKPVKNMVTVPNLMATMATLLGMSPDETVLSPAGRPISLTENGTAVGELIA